ncbi:MAG: nuclease-related domain-containing protein [Actinomycetota bacterium]
MIERELSNQASIYLSDAERAHEDARTEERSAHDQMADAEAAMAAATHHRSWWQRFLAVPSADERIAATLVARHTRAVIRAGRSIEQAEIARAKAAQGSEGELVLPTWFRTRLSDEWRMFQGYRNNRGEIDHLLLGPPGLWAVEVKTNRAKLRVYGDDWELTRLDGGGNEVGRRQATDGGGRTWGRQVGEPAAVLARRLAARSFEVPVRTAVLLVRPGARIVDVIKPGVDLVSAEIEEFDRAATAGPPILDHDQLAAIDEVIVEHHRQCQQ